MMSGTDCRNCSLGPCQCQQPEVIEMLNVLRHNDAIQTIEQIATSKLSSEERDDDGIDDDDLQVFHSNYLRNNKTINYHIVVMRMIKSLINRFTKYVKSLSIYFLRQ